MSDSDDDILKSDDDILKVVQGFDSDDDVFWNGLGLPNVNLVKERIGRNVRRKDVERAAPGITRDYMAKMKIMEAETAAEMEAEMKAPLISKPDGKARQKARIKLGWF